MDYYERGAVKKVWIEGCQYKAQVYGTELYTITVWEDEEEIKASCTCPYDWGGICKHSVAAMLALIKLRPITLTITGWPSPFLKFIKGRGSKRRP